MLVEATLLLNRCGKGVFIGHLKSIETILAYLHHKDNGVECNEGADEDFPLGGLQQRPRLILPTLHVLRHESLQRFRTDHKIETVFLERKKINSTMSSRW